MCAFALLFSDSSHSSTLGLGRHLWTPPDGKAFRPFPPARPSSIPGYASLFEGLCGRACASTCVCERGQPQAAVASVVELGQQR